MARLAKTGDLNERIEFITKTDGHQGEWGWEEGKEEVVLSCYASVRIQYFKDRMASIGTVLENSITFIIRYKQDVKIKNHFKIRFEDELYEINRIDPDKSRKEFTTITATKVGISDVS